jgi:hypothetical protein
VPELELVSATLAAQLPSRPPPQEVSSVDKRLSARIRRERGISPDEVAIPVETEPGQVAQADFAYASKLYDPEQGVLRKSWLFLRTLGHIRPAAAPRRRHRARGVSPSAARVARAGGGYP